MEHDLIRRSKLLAKKCMIRGHLDTGSPCPSKVKAVPVDVIEREPAVDAVEVVRCRECKHLDVVNRKELYAHCPKTNTVFLPFELDTREHFCSLGERKEGVEDG